MREVSPVEFAAIKTASRALVTQLGGLEAASLVCRYQKSALAECCSPNVGDRTLPADVVADLERCAGRPVVTRVLAGLAGHALVPLPSGAVSEARAIARVLADGAALSSCWADAVADARVSAQERQALKDRLLAVIDAAGQAVAALDAAGEGDAA